MADAFEEKVLPNIDRITEWAMADISQKEIAKRLEISYSTLRGYIKKAKVGEERFLALLTPFARAREDNGAVVEKSLFRLATGYQATVKKKFKLRHVEYDPQTGKKLKEWEELVDGDETVYIPANVAAQKFWLINKLPEKWKSEPQRDGASDDEGEYGVIQMPSVLDPEEADAPAAQDAAEENGQPKEARSLG